MNEDTPDKPKPDLISYYKVSFEPKKKIVLIIYFINLAFSGVFLFVLNSPETRKLHVWEGVIFVPVARMN